MTAAANKTVATGGDVDAFLSAVADPGRREDARAVTGMMRRVTGAEPAMWGPAIVGFGRYRYTYDSGRSGEMCRIGLSPRKAALTLYLTSGFATRDALLARLGQHMTGKGCLYLKRLSDVDPVVLEQLIAAAWADMDARYPDD